MNCEEAKKLIYLYDESSDTERLSIENHVSGCADCKTLFQEVQQRKGFVKQQFTVKAPDFPGVLTSRIMSAIENRPLTLTERISQLTLSMWLRPVMAIASLLLILMFAYEQSAMPDEIKASHIEAGVVLDSQRALQSLKNQDNSISYFSYLKEFKNKESAF